MPTEETAYKGRVSSFMSSVADKCSLDHWATALGVGAKSGVPDKWFQFGYIPVFWEAKKSRESARKLQEHQLKKLRQMGFIAFCTSANPDSTGAKGDERQEIIRAILEQLTPAKVDEYVLNYVSDAKKLRMQLEELLDD